jgi:hypothetical protein
VAKIPIDRLVDALAVVDELERVVNKHDRAIDRIVADQQEIMARLQRLETHFGGRETDGKP